MKIKNNKGITGVDVTIAVVILAMFVTLITNMFYNVSQIGVTINRKAEATYIAVQTIEAIKQAKYDDLPTGETDDTTLMTIDEKESFLEENNINLKNGYSVDIKIENYKKIKEDETLQDILKRVTVTVKYKEKTKDKKVELSTVILNEDNVL